MYKAFFVCLIKSYTIIKYLKNIKPHKIKIKNSKQKNYSYFITQTRSNRLFFFIKLTFCIIFNNLLFPYKIKLSLRLLYLIKLIYLALIIRYFLLRINKIRKISQSQKFKI